MALGPLGMTDLTEIIAWSKGLGNQGPFAPVKWSNPIVSLIAFAHTLIGGHFMFGFDWFYLPFARRFPHKLLLEERYLATQLPHVVRLASLAASAVAALAGIVFIGPCAFCPQQERGQKCVAPLLRVRHDRLADPARFLHIQRINGADDDRVVGRSGIGRRHRGRLVAGPATPSRGTILAGSVFAVALLVANGAGCILPQADLRTDYWYQANKFLIENARQGDIIFTDGGHLSDWYPAPLHRRRNRPGALRPIRAPRANPLGR